MLIRSNGIATRILAASLPIFAAGLLSPSAFAAHLTWQPRVSGQSGSDVLGHAGTAGQSGSDAISKSLTYLSLGHQPTSSWAAGIATDLDIIESVGGPQAIQ